MNQAKPATQKSVRFRGRSFIAFVLSPEAPLKGWLSDIDRWIANSPGFFAGRPVVLDLSVLRAEADQIEALVSHLADRGIRVMAIEGTDADTLGPDLPPVLRGAKPAVIDDPRGGKGAGKSVVAPEPAPQPAPEPTSLIIEAPIRSGQSVNHPHGDVIVMGSVGSGSEVIAGGSIHVYGTLRGRALAGAMGNSRARIFCRKNEAELLAVNGYYRTAEDIEPSVRGKPTQSFLDDGVLWVAVLD